MWKINFNFYDFFRCICYHFKDFHLIGIISTYNSIKKIHIKVTVLVYILHNGLATSSARHCALAIAKAPALVHERSEPLDSLHARETNGIYVRLFRKNERKKQTKSYTFSYTHISNGYFYLSVKLFPHAWKMFNYFCVSYREERRQCEGEWLMGSPGRE